MTYSKLLGLFIATALIFSGCSQLQTKDQTQIEEQTAKTADQTSPVENQTAGKLENFETRISELERRLLVEEKNIANLKQEIKLIPITTKDESKTAKDTLVTFFDYLGKNEFEKAVELYEFDNGFTLIEELTPAEEQDDKAKVLENFCKAVGTCLEVKVLETKRTTNYEYSMVVQFIKSDGTFYVFGPCCGATEEQMPSTDKFDYTVKKINGEFKVTTPPLYRP